MSVTFAGTGADIVAIDVAPGGTRNEREVSKRSRKRLAISHRRTVAGLASASRSHRVCAQFRHTAIAALQTVAGAAQGTLYGSVID
jgi:hypothetical protein